MATLATGMAFFPDSLSNEQWQLQILHRTLEALGGIGQVKEVVAPTERISHLSLEQQCERAALNTKYGGGCVKFDIAGFETTCRFSHPGTSIHLPHMILEMPRNSFGSRLTGDPMRVEQFAAVWSHLCDVQGAEWAYFSEGFPNEDQRVQGFIDALRSNNLQEIVGSNWRTYFGPALAVRWQQLDQPGMVYKDILPSGAYVFSSGRGYNPVLGDSNAEAFLHADFLREQIQMYPEINGAKRLLSRINQEVQILQAIEAQSFEERYDEKSHENLAVQDQVRKNLFQIRATWACALQREGLVGVAQVITKQPGGEIEIPVIAEQGRTWLCPTLHHPFDLHDKAWTAPNEGLETQILALLNAASQNLITGKPPHIVVYFWRGVTPEVHEALLAMGVSVEVATHLPILG